MLLIEARIPRLTSPETTILVLVACFAVRHTYTGHDLKIPETISSSKGMRMLFVCNCQRMLVYKACAQILLLIILLLDTGDAHIIHDDADVVDIVTSITPRC